MNNKRARGNVKEQRKRRIIRLKDRPKRRKQPYELIDGNITHYPSAYCKIHCGYLTLGLMETHRCVERKCRQLEDMPDGK